MSEWWRYTPSGPRRPAKNGIAARSRRGDIGERWWSKRFLEALEGITDPNRLKRGRSYARSGQVMELVIDTGEVGARVQGSRSKPYAVRIRVSPLTERQWGRVERAMAGQAVFLAALLAGEMPQQIEEAFAAAGVSLFPESADELATECSCPDWARPCKHVAAAFYILAEAFDTDPFLIFSWRGRTKPDLVARLRALRARIAGSARAEPGAAGRPTADPMAGGTPLPASATEFWSVGASLDELRFAPHPPDHPDALVRHLSLARWRVRGRPVAELLAAAYREATAAAARRARGD